MELLQGFPFCVCRVNLIGGRRAKGTPTDTAAVFTPAKAADRQLYMYNLTLPHGFFSRSPPGAADLFKTVHDENPCASKDEGYKEAYFPYPICKEPAMHQLLVDTALGAAQAPRAALSRRAARMSLNVLLRVDIALSWHGDRVRPFINEAHYYADASLMFPVWPPQPKSAHADNESQAAHPAQHQHATTSPTTEVTGWGLWLAEHVWREVQWRLTQRGQHMHA
ncbi:hypothetical protein ABBQ38_007617 [Trebouxia sp. C0009 RCD-2024]